MNYPMMVEDSGSSSEDKKDQKRLIDAQKIREMMEGDINNDNDEIPNQFPVIKQK